MVAKKNYIHQYNQADHHYLVCSKNLAQVVQKVDNVIHWINLYPVENAISYINAYSLDSNLSVRWHDTPFEQPWPQPEMVRTILKNYMKFFKMV